jgi:predicted dehydrogenase
MEPIRAAIVGPGKVAHTHAQALAAIPGVDVAAVCGRSMARAQAFAEQYGARAFDDLGAMLREADVQMVVICTPHPQHAEQAIQAMRHGAHALVEKPMATTVADCDRMLAAAAEAGVKLGAISQRRLYEPVLRVKQAIDAGRIGDVALGTVSVLGWRGPEYYAMDPWRGTWAGEGGGVLVNQTVHHLDLFQWLMGPVEELSGYWANLNHPEIEVEDTAVAVLRFRGGALGSIVVSNSQNPGISGTIHIHGRAGPTVGVQVDGGSVFISGVTTEVDPPINDIWTIPGEESMLAAWQAEDRARAREIDVMSHYHRLQIEDFVGAIRDGRPPLVPGEEGRKAVELFEAIYRSQREQRPIRFPL